MYVGKTVCPLGSRAKVHIHSWLLKQDIRTSMELNPKAYTGFPTSMGAFTVISQHTQRQVLRILETVAFGRLRPILCFKEA